MLQNKTRALLNLPKDYLVNRTVWRIWLENFLVAKV